MNTTSKTYSRTARLVSEEYHKILLPTILLAIAEEALVDSVCVGQFLGPEATTAVEMCSPALQFIYIGAILFSVGATVKISSALGARDRHEANRLFSGTLMLVGLTGALLTILGLVFLNPIVNLLTDAPEIRPLLHDYLLVTVICIIPYLLFTSLMVILPVDGMESTSTKAVILFQVANLVMDIVFLAVFHWGMYGAAIASQLGCFFGFLLMVYDFYKKDHNLALENPLKGFKPGLRLFGIFKSGLPAASGEVLYCLKLLLTYKIVQNACGLLGAEIFSTALPCFALACIIVEGTVNAMMPITGCLYGERDYLGVTLMTRHALTYALLFVIVVVAFIMAFPNLIFNVFQMPDEVISAGSTALRIFSLSMIGYTFNYILMYYYTTLGKEGLATAINMIESFFITVPLAWVLSKKWGINGAMAAFVIAEIATTLFIIIYTRSKGKSLYPRIYMLGNEDGNSLYDVSLKASVDNAVKVSVDAGKVLEQHGFSSVDARTLGLMLEEMTVNACEYPQNRNKKVNMDIKISEFDNEFLISCRDDGAPFNPTVEAVEDGDEIAMNSITLVKAMASEVKFDRLLSFNQTLITINKES